MPEHYLQSLDSVWRIMRPCLRDIVKIRGMGWDHTASWLLLTCSHFLCGIHANGCLGSRVLDCRHLSCTLELVTSGLSLMIGKT